LDTIGGGNLVYGRDYDLVAELAKCSRQHLSPFPFGLRIRLAALLDKSHPFMQDLPDEAAQTMGDGPDGGLIAQPRQQTPEHGLKMTAFLRDGSVRSLVQHPPQIFIAFRHLGAFRAKTGTLEGTHDTAYWSGLCKLGVAVIPLQNPRGLITFLSR
jgi:hypothetical protein